MAAAAAASEIRTTNGSGPAAAAPSQYSVPKPPTTTRTIAAAAAAASSSESSFPLQAMHCLLQDVAEGDTVYLLDRTYMSNWLRWCLHQQTTTATAAADPHHPQNPWTDRIRRAAEQLQIAPWPPPAVLDNTTTDNPIATPSPIDTRGLSAPGQALRLDASVQSLNHQPPLPNSKNAQSMRLTNGGTPPKPCVAVPEPFYELLRSVHGVLCDDFETVSFQSNNHHNNHSNNNNNSMMETDENVVLYHHVFATDNDKTNGASSSSVPCRPIEFRRRVISQTLSTVEPKGKIDTSLLTLMEKLMLEEQQQQETMAPHQRGCPQQLIVEVHPIQLLYTIFPIPTTDAATTKGNNDAEEEDAATIAATLSNGDLRKTRENGHAKNNTITNASIREALGFVLVSRDTPAIAAVAALQRLVAPRTASQSVRTWSKYNYNTTTTNKGSAAANPPGASSSSTASHDNGYELIDMDSLAEAVYTNPQSLQQPTYGAITTTSTKPISMGAWVNQHSFGPEFTELDLLVETRRSVNVPWPREHLELANRIQPGDLVDAQDVAGKWYEAVVQKVEDETVLVHYTGWASKWDSKVRRRNASIQNSTSVTGGVDGATGNVPPNSSTPADVPSKVKAPAPLWSRSQRWREQLQLGDALEVRDSGSIVERPKWYSGVVKRIGEVDAVPKPLTGGASIDMYSLIEGEEKTPLLILGRTQQILVEVEQERREKASIVGNAANSSPTSKDDSLVPQPPFLRWVNLFGEEICQSGTHLKEVKDEGPVTLKYEFDANRKPVEVMKSHPMHGAGFMRESLRGTPPAPGSVGLHNLGNSCFLNSTVQCLNHIEPLTQFFVLERYSKDLNKRNPLGSGGNVAVAYASLLKKMWAGQHSVIVPRMLKQTVANFAPQFDNSYQHDSHEFCQFLMDGLHEDLNRVKKKPYVEELEGWDMEDQRAAIESWRKHLLRHDSIIVDHCQGMHRSHLTCPQCGRESIKFDIFSSISLPLPIEKKITTIKLEDCMEKFMEAEQLDERDAYYCPNCRRHVCALKLIALWTVPNILILHLKRFTFDTCMLSGGMLRSKIDNTVEFPINGLDLTEHVLGPIDPDAPPIYNLFGVSEHSGPTANSGHYTATVRNSVDGQWYRCNDSNVGLTSGEAAITGGAYLLFYQRAKGIIKWGGLHKIMKEMGIDPYGGMEPIDEEGYRQVKNKKKKKG